MKAAEMDIMAFGRNPVVRARNLVTALIAETGKPLFGANAAASRQSFQGQATIPNGDVTAYLTARIERYGIDGITTGDPATPLDTRIVAIARDIAKQAVRTDGAGADKIQQIAIEYVTASCFVRPTEVMRFADYLARATELRQHFHAIAEAKRLTAAPAFDELDEGTVQEIGEVATAAWGKIEALYASAPFMHTLRRRILAYPVFSDLQAWRLLKSLARENREATVAQIYALMAERGTPFVTTATVVDAWNRVQGNLAISVGDAYGITPDAFIEATGHDTFAGARADGAQVTFERGSVESVGTLLSGLFGSLSGSMRRVSDRELAFTATIREGLEANPMPVAIDVVPAQGTERPQHWN